MKLLWLDLETTGLNPQKDVILELAIIQADFLNPFVPLGDGYHSILEFDVDSKWNQALHPIDPYVQRMHTINGLFDKCKESKNELRNLDKQLIEKYGPKQSEVDDRPILAGSTIHFDHSFIKYHLPLFDSILSYRHYDVTTIQLFCRSLGMPKLQKVEAHRAVFDIIESMNNGRKCVNWLEENPEALQNIVIKVNL